jgi:hypothetical protein
MRPYYDVVLSRPWRGGGRWLHSYLRRVVVKAVERLNNRLHNYLKLGVVKAVERFNT